MIEFAAARFEEDGEYAETVLAETVEEAQAICDRNGWELLGWLAHEFPYDVDHPPPSMEVH